MATNRLEWLEEADYDDVPQQYVAVIVALGDWIESELHWRAASRALATPSITGFEACKALQLEVIRRKVETQDSAKRRAIEAGYVWCLDLDST